MHQGDPKLAVSRENNLFLIPSSAFKSMPVPLFTLVQTLFQTLKSASTAAMRGENPPKCNMEVERIFFLLLFSPYSFYIPSIRTLKNLMVLKQNLKC